jgi:hypothetical protein
MGLDMYLNKRLYVGGQYRDLEGEIDATFPDKQDGEYHVNIPWNRVSAIEMEGIYWRKANAIHRWFVDNVQQGEDNCGTYHVCIDHLIALREVCEKALFGVEEAIAELEPLGGFFFGSTDKDEGWKYDLQYTIDGINQLEKDDDWERAKNNLHFVVEYTYNSSW